MLSFQKSTSDRIGLEYDFSSSITTSTNTIVFVPPSNNVEIENNDVKTDLAKTKSLKQKSKQKKQHICHHYGATVHTRPNCYKWLATQQSNNMISSRN